MEQDTKRCPYCGEEILAIAKKCKHCGEWLVKSANYNNRQPVKKESHFDSKYLYDKVWMKVLFWATIVGAFIQAVHLSEITVEQEKHGITRAINYMIFSASMVPEAIGDLLCGAGEICFIMLLMNVFSKLHNPLKGWFITYIVFAVSFKILYVISGDSQDEVFLLTETVLGLAIIIPIILLPIMIISNYEGKIKTLGWVMISYIIASIITGFVADNIVSDAAFLIIFLIDFFYYRYLRKILTKC
jgi:hypothetical protein